MPSCSVPAAMVVPACIAVAGGEDGGAGADWLTLPLPEMTPPKVTLSERSKARAPLSVTSPTMLPRGTAIAQLQRPCRDGGAAGVTIGGGEDGGARRRSG